MLGREVRRVIDGLDPQANDAEITHLSLEVLMPPMLSHIGYASAGAHVVAVPRVAERILRGGEGDQVLDPRRRDADTLTFFGELIRRGHRSPAGMSERTRECLGYEPISTPMTTALQSGWRSFLATRPLRPVRLDSSWVKTFSRVGADPDLERIGYGA